MDVRKGFSNRAGKALGVGVALGVLVATFGWAEAAPRVTWTARSAPIAIDWRPGPLGDELALRALSARGDFERKARPPAFSWPLRQSSKFQDNGFWANLGFVDHDPRFPGFLLDYEGGDRTYDIPGGYNHLGTDLINWPFGWAKQGLEQVEVIASAPGRIALRIDGNFDRECAAGFDEDREANVVAVQHNDGSIALYGHLKSGSVTRKRVGDRVERGEYLGTVGSSGFSGYPHLHFEVLDVNGNVIDPFAGPFNNTIDESWWIDQPAYYDTHLLAAMTHSADPLGGQCRRHERTFVSNRFAPGDVVYLIAYMRDLQRRQPMRYTIRDADGEVFENGKTKSRMAYVPIGGLYGEFDLPDDALPGTWTYSLTFEGETLEGSFEVGEFEPERGVNRVTPAALQPGARRKMTLRGFGFAKGSAIDVQRQDDVGKSIEVVKAKIRGKKIVLTLRILNSAVPGPRDIVVTAPDYTQLVVEDAFRVQ